MSVDSVGVRDDEASELPRRTWCLIRSSRRDGTGRLQLCCRRYRDGESGDPLGPLIKGSSRWALIHKPREALRPQPTGYLDGRSVDGFVGLVRPQLVCYSSKLESGTAGRLSEALAREIGIN